ncbi:Os08g0381600 [Oryza sativa Japonica Group]|uniref:Os08g0381600 protein n=3 Tax=Oryza TaxID=4527 RepID=Q0J607_ORYSJ|nr:hypothetical protein OsJ_27137 [Oryza sativa Japonica Group]BAF23608.2 Os08g0381600 [Oryza sativa Japonica Group]|eukprot:NP_001061694.2 Os08g0381600 [Oryza sativa Japonica Group]
MASTSMQPGLTHDVIQKLNKYLRILCNKISANMPADELLHVLKGLCPDAYSYAKDDQTSTFTCPAGTNHRVDFCPPTSGVTAGDDDGVRGHRLPQLSCRICAAAAVVLLPPQATASRG